MQKEIGKLLNSKKNELGKNFKRKNKKRKHFRNFKNINKNSEKNILNQEENLGFLEKSYEDLNELHQLKNNDFFGIN